MMTVNVDDAVRADMCINDGLYFARFFMKERIGSKMIVSPHHKIIQNTLDKTINGNITRLIITLPPGYSKTEMASICYMARGLAINAKSRFLHLSYSHNLALLNSSTIRSIMKLPSFQDMWPMKTKDDSDSKSMWWTTDGGGVYATSSAGQVTGFRAGHMNHSADNFTGALIIDDPVKPDDAYSEVMREGVNNRFNETIASRLAVESVPIIIIMQRIHHNDLSGYLLRGGSGEKWHHLNLPVIIDNNAEYPEEYTHGIPIEHGLENGWLWHLKHNDEHQQALQSHRRKFLAQYMQNPVKRNSEFQLWTEKLITECKNVIVDELEIIRTVVSIDPAVSNTESSDAHGIIVASSHSTIEGENFSVNADYTRHGTPLEWAKAAIFAFNTHDADCIVIETNQGGDLCEQNLRNAGFQGRIVRYHAKRGKVLRAEPIVALYELGLVRHNAGLLQLEEELLDFDVVEQKSNGKSPNRLDALVYALGELSGIGAELGALLELSMGE